MANLAAVGTEVNAFPVYLGIWTNWSNGAIFGSTLTISRQNGALLIAFIAYFIAFVASRFWRIICLVFHFSFSSRTPQDAVHHQRQALLRNTFSAEGGILNFAGLLWAWRTVPTRSSSRLLPMFFLALVCTACFAVAGGFSSRVSDGIGSEVLLRGDGCGYLSIVNIDADALTSVNLIRRSQSKAVADQANYARQCYSNESSAALNCGTFVRKELLSLASINTQAPCPFGNDMCVSKDANIVLDSGYLDSNDHMGLNTPSDQRYQARFVLSCAPLKTEGYTTLVAKSANESITRYHYGMAAGAGRANYTYQYNTNAANSTHLTYVNSSGISDYTMGFKKAAAFNGTFSYDLSDFIPVPALSPAALNGSVYLIFLSANSVAFTSPTEDLWYKATTRSKYDLPAHFSNGTEEQIPAYIQDQPASPMGCLQQMQLCNPSLPADAQCTELTGLDDAASSFMAMNAAPDKQPFFEWALDQGLGYRLVEIDGVVETLGSQSLTSRYGLNEGVQLPVPNNQWQLDVISWFSTTLVSVQQSFVDIALGPTGAELNRWKIGPSSPLEQHLCGSQKIKTTEFSNFSMFGILFIFVVGGLIIITSLLLEPLLTYLQYRYRYREYQNLEWCSNHVLQLQRMAHEEVGCGTWNNTDGYAPVTHPAETLAMLDIADPAHPRLHSAFHSDYHTARDHALYTTQQQDKGGDFAAGGPVPTVDPYAATDQKSGNIGIDIGLVNGLDPYLSHDAVGVAGGGTERDYLVSQEEYSHHLPQVAPVYSAHPSSSGSSQYYPEQLSQQPLQQQHGYAGYAQSTHSYHQYQPEQQQQLQQQQQQQQQQYMPVHQQQFEQHHNHDR